MKFNDTLQMFLSDKMIAGETWLTSFELTEVLPRHKNSVLNFIYHNKKGIRTVKLGKTNLYRAKDFMDLAMSKAFHHKWGMTEVRENRKQLKKKFYFLLDMRNPLG